MKVLVTCSKGENLSEVNLNEKTAILKMIQNYLESQSFEILKKLWVSLECTVNASNKNDLITLILKNYNDIPFTDLQVIRQTYLHRESCFIFRGF